MEKFWDKISTESFHICTEEYKTLEKIFGDKFGDMVRGSKCRGGYNTHGTDKNFIRHKKRMEDMVNNILKIPSDRLKINDKNVKELYNFLGFVRMHIREVPCSNEFEASLKYLQDVTEIEN